jgi:tRNA 2-thiouridine synthesizing protein A
LRDPLKVHKANNRGSGCNRIVDPGVLTMAVEILDMLGMKCPQPVLKIAVKAPQMNSGDILEVVGDCPTFERDVRVWCQRMNKIFLSIRDEQAGEKRIQIQF